MTTTESGEICLLMSFVLALIKVSIYGSNIEKNYQLRRLWCLGFEGLLANQPFHWGPSDRPHPGPIQTFLLPIAFDSGSWGWWKCWATDLKLRQVFPKNCVRLDRSRGIPFETVPIRRYMLRCSLISCELARMGGTLLGGEKVPIGNRGRLCS